MAEQSTTGPSAPPASSPGEALRTPGQASASVRDMAYWRHDLCADLNGIKRRQQHSGIPTRPVPLGPRRPDLQDWQLLSIRESSPLPRIGNGLSHRRGGSERRAHNNVHAIGFFRTSVDARRFADLRMSSQTSKCISSRSRFLSASSPDFVGTFFASSKGRGLLQNASRCLRSSSARPSKIAVIMSGAVGSRPYFADAAPSTRSARTSRWFQTSVETASSTQALRTSSASSRQNLANRLSGDSSYLFVRRRPKSPVEIVNCRLRLGICTILASRRRIRTFRKIGHLDVAQRPYFTAPVFRWRPVARHRVRRGRSHSPTRATPPDSPKTKSGRRCAKPPNCKGRKAFTLP